MTAWPITDDTPPGVMLEEGGKRIRAACAATPGLSALSNPAAQRFYLAWIFDEQVRRDGFRGLFVTLAGSYLGETEDMLLLLAPKRAHPYYVSAVKACLAATSEFNAMLRDGGAPTVNSLAGRLDLLSMDYLSADPRFLDEAAPGIRMLWPEVRAWLARANPGQSFEA